MHTIYAPWRKEYFGSQESSCVFCAISSAPDSDTQNRVFYRDDFCFGVMNRFPYTPGHFMLIPHAHCDSPELLDSKTWAHIQNLSQKAFGILYEYGASGINMGMNIDNELLFSVQIGSFLPPVLSCFRFKCFGLRYVSLKYIGIRYFGIGGQLRL